MFSKEVHFNSSFRSQCCTLHFHAGFSLSIQSMISSTTIVCGSFTLRIRIVTCSWFFLLVPRVEPHHESKLLIVNPNWIKLGTSSSWRKMSTFTAEHFAAAIFWPWTASSFALCAVAPWRWAIFGLWDWQNVQSDSSSCWLGSAARPLESSLAFAVEHK